MPAVRYTCREAPLLLVQSISRRVFAIGMSCVIVVGTAPRLDCLCPDIACQFGCEHLLAGPKAETPPAKPACCCNHSQKPVPPVNGLAAGDSGCHCDMQVVQEKSPLARQPNQESTPQVLWLAADELTLSQSRPELRPGRSLFTGLPPDDPVSRAQILRL